MPQINRRRFTRFHVDWRAALFVPSGNAETPVEARVVDISAGGAGVLTARPLPPGSTHRMAIAIPNFDRTGYMYAQGKFRSVDSFLTKSGDFRSGMELTEMDDASQKNLMWFLKEEARRLEWVYSHETNQFEFVKEDY